MKSVKCIDERGLHDLPAVIAYGNNIRDIPILPKEEIVSLLKKAHTLKEKFTKEDLLSVSEYIWIQNAVVSSNLRLVCSIANMYYGNGLSYPDFVQEGNLALINAVYKYDILRGTAFSTFVYGEIRGAITKALSTQRVRPVHVPRVYMIFYYKILRAKDELRSKYFREPDIDEVADYLGLTVDRVNDIIRWNTCTRSLSDPVYNEKEGGPIRSSVNDDSIVLRIIEDKEAADCFLSILSIREKKVMWKYYVEGETLGSISKSLGYSNEMVRVIKESAISRIREEENIVVPGEVKNGKKLDKQTSKRGSV